MTDWSAVVREYGPLVWQTAYRLLGNDSDTADCFQEVFVSAVKLSRRQHIDHWPGLLQRVATTLAINQFHRRYRHSQRLRDSTDYDAIASPNPGPAEHAEAQELIDHLRRAIARLPRREAEVVSLRCLSELSYEEIAEYLSLEVNAVGVILHRARRRLRRMLGPLQREVKP